MNVTRLLFALAVAWPAFRGVAGEAPQVFRTFMPEAGASAFAVALTPELALCYDGWRGGVNQAWRGTIDLAPTLRAKINQPAAIRGDVFYAESLVQPLRIGDPTKVPMRRSKGYHFAGDAVIFDFTLDGVPVSETLRMADGGRALERSWRVGAADSAVFFLAEPQTNADVTFTGGRLVSPGVWKFASENGAMTIAWRGHPAIEASAGKALPRVESAPAAKSQSRTENIYEIEEIPLPPAIVPEISGVTFTPAGELVIVNRHGEVWITPDPKRGPWRRFALGLHEPLGVLAVSAQEILVTQRPELTRLRDIDGDGAADRYETLNDDWGVTDNWHEFTFGLHRDRDGNLLLATGLPDVAGPINPLHPREPLRMDKVHQELKPSPGRYEGWLLKVDGAGRLTPLACGFRAAAGVGISPDGDIFITDQQGDYIATSTLVHVQPGRFYGHPASLKWRDDYRGPLDLEALTRMRAPEAVALPHGAMGGSPGEPVWDTTGGKFGPFAGQVFIGDFTKLISRVFLEKVAGEYQGACFPLIRDAVGLEAIKANSGSDNLTIPAGKDGLKYFRDATPRVGTPLRGGNMRMAFAPDGSLYVAQTTRGWGQGDGLQRIVWSGRTPVEIAKMELTHDGFRLTFTTAMDAARLRDAKTYRLGRFRYLYLPKGSPRVDETAANIRAIRVADDGRSVELAVEDLQPGYIYELEVERLRSADQRAVENPHAFYTLTRSHDGRGFTGPMSQPLIAAQDNADRGPDPEAGRRIYGTFCVTCHQPDGKGGALPGTADAAPALVAANFTLRGTGAPLSKPDAELLRSITDGPPGKPMPPFGSVLKPHEIRDVLAYLRSAFGELNLTNP